MRCSAVSAPNGERGKTNFFIIFLPLKKKNKTKQNLTRLPTKQCYYTSSFHSCLYWGGENCQHWIIQEAVSEGELHRGQQWLLLGLCGRPAVAHVVLAAPNAWLVLVLPKPGTVSPVGVKGSEALSQREEPQEKHGNVWSKRKPLYNLISHL